MWNSKRRLMEELTEQGNYDTFVICYMGFPIPRGAVKIDLALTKGVPTFIQALKAVLIEVVVQEALLMEKIKEVNKEQNDKVCGLLTKQDIKYLSFKDFRAESE